MPPYILILQNRQLHRIPYVKETFLCLNKDLYSNKKGYGLYLMEFGSDEGTIKELERLLGNVFGVEIINEKEFDLQKWQQTVKGEEEIEKVLEKFSLFSFTKNE